MLDIQSAAPAAYSPQVLFRAMLAEHLMSFTRYAFEVIRPGIPFRPNWHLEAMTHKLAQVASGEIRRLIINVPPRNLKSLCASVALPAWFLGKNPSERVIVASYSDLLSRNHSNDFRRLVNDPIYQATFPAMRVERESDREIMTTKRGKRIATSIEGTLTGLGGNLIIIDDPLKSGDAMSESVRSRVIEWYRSTLLSRPDDKTAARIVLVMQRVHQDDLAGYLREQGGFDVLSLPAIAQRDETHYLGDGRVKERLKGELLHPEHEPAKVLLELKREMGPIAFSAQYQQDPIPPGGTIIKRKWLTPYDSLAVASRTRIEPLPDVPTVIESGYKDYEAEIWFGLSLQPRMSQRDFPPTRERCVLCHGAVAGTGCVLHWRKDAMELGGIDGKAQGVGPGRRNPAILDGAIDSALAQPSGAGSHPKSVCHGIASRFVGLRKCMSPSA